MVAALIATAIDYLAKEVNSMKWYFVPLSVLGITFLGGLGWYIGGLEEPYLACAAVVLVGIGKLIWQYKWYYFGPLSLLVSTLGGLFGWYFLTGESSDYFKHGCFAVMTAAVAYSFMCIFKNFKGLKRISSSEFSSVPLAIVGVLNLLTFAVSLAVSHHYHL